MVFLSLAYFCFSRVKIHGQRRAPFGQTPSCVSYLSAKHRVMGYDVVGLTLEWKLRLNTGAWNIKLFSHILRGCVGGFEHSLHIIT